MVSTYHWTRGIGGIRAVLRWWSGQPHGTGAWFGSHRRVNIGPRLSAREKCGGTLGYCILLQGAVEAVLPLLSPGTSDKTLDPTRDRELEFFLFNVALWASSWMFLQLDRPVGGGGRRQRVVSHPSATFGRHADATSGVVISG